MVPATLLLIFVLLCVNFGRIAETLIVMLSLPFALIGGLRFVWWIGFNLSVALAVGFIALAGVAAETGVVMLIYADQALAVRQADCRREQRTLGRADLDGAIIEGATERVRPKIMTVTAIVAGLVPILWNDGTGSEVMQRIAVPMIGGMASSILLTLLVIPAIYGLIKGHGLPRPSLRADRDGYPPFAATRESWPADCARRRRQDIEANRTKSRKSVPNGPHWRGSAVVSGACTNLRLGCRSKRRSGGTDNTVRPSHGAVGRPSWISYGNGACSDWAVPGGIARSPWMQARDA